MIYRAARAGRSHRPVFSIASVASRKPPLFLLDRHGEQEGKPSRCRSGAIFCTFFAVGGLFETPRFREDGRNPRSTKSANLIGTSEPIVEGQFGAHIDRQLHFSCNFSGNRSIGGRILRTSYVGARPPRSRSKTAPAIQRGPQKSRTVQTGSVSYTSRCLNASGTSLKPFDFTTRMMKPITNQVMPMM